MICCICGKVSPETHTYCLYCGTQSVSARTAVGLDHQSAPSHSMLRRCEVVAESDDSWISQVLLTMTSLRYVEAAEITY